MFKINFSCILQKKNTLMKKLHYLVILLLFVLSSSCGSEEKTDEITEDTEISSEKEDIFTDQKEGFKVAFPKKPTKSEGEVIVDGIGSIKITDYICTKDGYIYMLSISPQSTENIKNDKDKISLLVSTKDGFCSDMQLQITEEKEIRIDDNPGILIKANSKDYHTVFSILFANSSLYQITVLSKKGEIPAEIIENFINSFELLK